MTFLGTKLRWEVAIRYCIYLPLLTVDNLEPGRYQGESRPGKVLVGGQGRMGVSGVFEPEAGSRNGQAKRTQVSRVNCFCW